MSPIPYTRLIPHFWLTLSIFLFLVHLYNKHFDLIKTKQSLVFTSSASFLLSKLNWQVEEVSLLLTSFCCSLIKPIITDLCHWHCHYRWCNPPDPPPVSSDQCFWGYMRSISPGPEWSSIIRTTKKYIQGLKFSWCNYFYSSSQTKSTKTNVTCTQNESESVQ